MTKYTIKSKPFSKLKKGDIIASDYGLRFIAMEKLEAGYVRLTLESRAGDIHHVTHHSSNWPDVATGFTPDYRDAYPDEVFA
jgi:hypothetical protein